MDMERAEVEFLKAQVEAVDSRSGSMDFTEWVPPSSPTLKALSHIDAADVVVKSPPTSPRPIMTNATNKHFLGGMVHVVEEFEASPKGPGAPKNVFEHVLHGPRPAVAAPAKVQ